MNSTYKKEKKNWPLHKPHTFTRIPTNIGTGGLGLNAHGYDHT